MPDFSQFQIGEQEGGVVLVCPECGPSRPVGFIGGDTIAKLAARTAQHNAEKHSGMSLGGYAALITHTEDENGNPVPQWPAPPGGGA